MKNPRLLLSMVIALFMFGGLTACNEDDDPITPEVKTIAQIASETTQFSTLVSALDRVDLVNVLDSEGTYTVFAPTNDAFTALGVDLNTISDEDLTNILLYHVIGTEIPSMNIADGQTYASTASTAGPNNAALSVLIEKSSDGVMINNTANVTTADIMASNGVIHIIDAVITPLDVVGHAAANKNFTQLVGALSAASGSLVDVLQTEGPFTVFAPVNSAFEEISEVVETLSMDDLSNILLYHVAEGNVRSTDLSDGMTVNAVNGDSFTINLDSGASITDANGGNSIIALTDVQATNGVIHVIETVILP